MEYFEDPVAPLIDVLMAVMCKVQVKKLIFTKAELMAAQVLFPNHSLVVEGNYEQIEVSIMETDMADKYVKNIGESQKNIH